MANLTLLELLNVLRTRIAMLETYLATSDFDAHGLPTYLSNNAIENAERVIALLDEVRDKLCAARTKIY